MPTCRFETWGLAVRLLFARGVHLAETAAAAPLPSREGSP